MKLFRRLFMSLIFFLALICIPSVVQADETIRVLLKQGINEVQFAVIQGDYQLVDGGTGSVVAKLRSGEVWSVFKEGLNIKVRREGDPSSLSFVGAAMLEAGVGSEQSLFRLANIRYRGELVFYSVNTGLMAVNVLNIEDYLLGVLPKEMGSGFPEEALKAQAVVSRTIAMFRRGNFSYYDITAGALDQVYGGYEAELAPNQERIRRAVNETRGEMIYYDGSLIEAIFHSNAGGYTISSESVWGGNRPYLQPVPSPYDSYALDYPYQREGWPANSYKWTITYSLFDLRDRIDTWNKAHPEAPILIGRLEELRPYWALSSDNPGSLKERVDRLEMVGTQGIASIFGDRIRQVFGLKSNSFALEGGASVALLSGKDLVNQVDGTSPLAVVSADGRVTIPEQGNLFVKSQNGIQALRTGADGYVFTGRGFGHGVGMSQWGAIGMAQAGYNYQEIVEHYYNQDKFDGRLQIHSR